MTPEEPRLASRHQHVFLGEDHQRNETRTWIVIGLTTATMVLEIVAGSLFGSMALVADGWHMSTHAAALMIAALAYLYARRHARDPRFTFGTGKLGDLAGFASAIVLALVALFIAWESAQRLMAPVPIDFGQAIAVASFGLRSTCSAPSCSATTAMRMATTTAIRMAIRMAMDITVTIIMPMHITSTITMATPTTLITTMPTRARTIRLPRRRSPRVRCATTICAAPICMCWPMR